MALIQWELWKGMEALKNVIIILWIAGIFSLGSLPKLFHASESKLCVLLFDGIAHDKP